MRRVLAWLTQPRGALLVSALAALLIRCVRPYGRVFTIAYVNFQGDAWYHMRKVDWLIANFPHGLQYDPYLLGMYVPIPPLFDGFVAALALLAGLGSPSSAVAETVAAFVPPVLAALTLLPLFAIGHRVFDRRAGLVAAALFAIMPSPHLVRSLLGVVDHHVAEALLSLLVLWLLTVAAQDAAVSRAGDGARAAARALLWPVAAGAALGAYLLTWSGGAFLVILVVVWVVLQYNLEPLVGHSGPPLAWIAAPTLLVALAFVLAVQDPGMHRRATQLGALLGGLAVVVGLEALRAALRRTRLGPRAYPALCLAGAVAGFVALPERYARATLDLFGDVRRLLPGVTDRTVGEIRPLLEVRGEPSLVPAWEMYSTPLVVFLIVLPVFGMRALRRGRRETTLLAIWCATVFALTVGQNRFGYYLASAVALLCGWAASALLGFAEGAPALRRRLAAAVVVLVLFVPALDAGVRLSGADEGIPSGWHAGLRFLRRETEEPFGDPAFYVARGRLAPPPLHTVLAWWDYGYWIVRVARRVPLANPTQSGASESAAVLTATDEAEAEGALRERRVRYVIVDDLLPLRPGAEGELLGKFPTLVTWAEKPASRFWEGLLERGPDGRLGPVAVYHPDYYRTLAARMHLFSGKAVAPRDSTWVVRVVERRSAAGDGFREIVESTRFATYEEAERHASLAGPGALLVGRDPLRSCVPLEALTRFGLVFESTDADVRPLGLPAVRIFEYRPAGSSTGEGR